MTEQIDKDSQEEINEGETIRHGVKGDFWGIIKARLWNEIVKMTNVLNIDEPNPDKRFLEVEVRKETADTLINLIKEIEGDAEKTEDNSELVDKQLNKGHIMHIKD